MKALTVLQPWATLIVAGAKPYEFRRWLPPVATIGQRIIIHAAKRKIDQAETDKLFFLLRDGAEKNGQHPGVIETCLDAEKALPILDPVEPLKLGAAVGTAVLGVPRAAEEIAEELGVRIDPVANSATSYTWLFWRTDTDDRLPLDWIPPCRKRLERTGDYELPLLVPSLADPAAETPAQHEGLLHV